MARIGMGVSNFQAGTVAGQADVQDGTKGSQVVVSSRDQSANSTVGVTSGNSGSFDRRGYAAVGLLKLLSFATAAVVALKIQVSHDDSTYRDLRTASGALVTIAITQASATDAYDLPAEAMSFPFIRVVTVDNTQTLVSVTVASSLMWVASS